MPDEKEKTLGLNEGDETSSGGGQPEKQTTDVSSEIDNIVSKEESGEADVEDYDENSVLVPKDEWERIRRDKENYKKGLLSLKDKLKVAEEKESKPEPKQKGEFLTRKEYLKSIEKQAIAKACKDPDVNDNWDKIVEYYIPRHGRETVESIVADVEKAHKLFRLEHPKQDDEGKKAAAKASAEQGKPKGKSQASKGKKKEGRKILKRPQSPDEWY